MKKCFLFLLGMALIPFAASAQNNLVSNNGNNDTETAVNSSAPAESEDDVVFIVVEQMPEFPGGFEAMRQYLMDNVVYPESAKKDRVEGRVVCQFVVNTDGTITEVIVVRTSGDERLDAEAVRVIQSMPVWKPGKQRGKNVRVKYTMPVNFRLD
ncbi:MAG: energy transducer TonB [Paludibacteraceae bacterium]|nr:energy transducer TonB [Paludibacteraceae bacterium]